MAGVSVRSTLGFKFPGGSDGKASAYNAGDLGTRTFRITQFINLPWLNNPPLIRLAVVPFRVDPVEIPIILGIDLLM